MSSKVILLKELDEQPRQLIVYGGTFDPIHQGHLSVIRALLNSFKTVLLAPTDQNPWKESNASPLALRREMLNLVLRSEGLEKDVSVSDLSYVFTEEFVSQLRKDTENSKDPVYWAIGEDSIDSPPKWKNFDKLNLVVVAAPVSFDIHATQIRNGEVAAHSSIVKFIELNGLYN